MTDPRNLIQRLADELHKQTCLYEGYEDSLVAEARAYLATPEPAAGPTDDDAEDLADRAELLSGYADDPHGFYVRDSDLGAYARAVLARYGNQPPQPIPLSERLPGPEDCDAEGRCWWWIVEQPGQFPHWIYAPVEVVSWAGYLAWLPHHALPLPPTT